MNDSDATKGATCWRNNVCNLQKESLKSSSLTGELNTILCLSTAGEHNYHHGDEELFLPFVSASRNPAGLHLSAACDFNTGDFCPLTNTRTQRGAFLISLLLQLINSNSTLFTLYERCIYLFLFFSFLRWVMCGVTFIQN